MGVIQSLARINEELEKRASNSNFEERVPATWVKVDDGQTVKLIFLQEIDEGSPNYLPENGTVLFSTQHENPDNWKKKAECTDDEGECYGCSRGWPQKLLIYANVLVDDGTNEPYVAIWSRGVGKKSVAKQLIDMAGDSDYDNSITQYPFKFSREGTKKETVYSLTPTPKPHDKDLTQYELFDLKKYLFYVSPEKQEEYYLGGENTNKEAKVEEDRKPVSASSVDSDW